MSRQPDRRTAEIQEGRGPSLFWTREEEWLLLRDADVEIRRANSVTVDSGRVEAVTADGRILWLALEGASPRRLYDKATGVEAWVLRRDAAG
jgi:hypothetical protein